MVRGLPFFMETAMLLDDLEYKVEVRSGKDTIFMTHYSVEGHGSEDLSDDVALKVASDILKAALVDRENVRSEPEEIVGNDA